MALGARLQRGYPSRELCLSRLQHYDEVIADRGWSSFLQEQREFWERMLGLAQRHENREATS